MRAVISTNGTLITQDVAARLKEAGLSYVGISLDGLEPTNDRFRGVQGAFRKALEGVRNCLRAGVKVGLRFTMTRENFRRRGRDSSTSSSGKAFPASASITWSTPGAAASSSTTTACPTRRPASTVDLIMDRTQGLPRRGQGGGSADRGQPRGRPLSLPAAPAKRTRARRRRCSTC